jgi:GntR family transcriptional regulator, rspAB operon transcriptional repressor
MESGAEHPPHGPVPGRRIMRRPGPPMLAQAARPSASSLVESELRQGIIAMRLRPGEALNEKEIAAQFGLSRTPVREAMLRLRDDELIEIFPQSGTFVARIPIAKIPEAVIIRQALEAMAVEQAARRREPRALQALHEIIRQQEEAAEAGDHGRFHEVDEAFHAGISDAAGYPGIWRLAQTVKAQVDRCRRLTLPVPGRMARVIQEHRRVLAAIEAGDVAEARDGLAEHLVAVLPDLEEIRATHPDYFV